MRSLLYLAILTTVVVFAMVSFNIFHNYITSKISEDVSIEIAPITPVFNKDALENVRQRKEIVVDLKTASPEALPKATPFKRIEEKLATSSGVLELQNEEL